MFFVFLMFLLIINANKTSLVKLKLHAFSVEILITINTKRFLDNVTELKVVAEITKISTVFNIIDNFF